jgi:DNA-binding response OmpR family regulator
VSPAVTIFGGGSRDDRHDPAAAADGLLAPGTAARPRLLLVEDEFLEALHLEQELAAAGYEIVGPFHSLAAGLEAAQGAELDLALLDVNLRGERVYPLADELTAQGVPFVFLSGYLAIDLPERFRARPRLSKPHEPAVLLRELRRLLAGN